MTSMIREVFEALRSIGVDESKAQSAAAAMSVQSDAVGDLKLSLESRIGDLKLSIEGRLNGFETVTKGRFADVERDVAVLKWIAGGNTALLIIVLGKLLLMHG